MDKKPTTLRKLRALFPDMKFREPDEGMTEVVVISKPPTSPVPSSKKPMGSLPTDRKDRK